MTMIFTWTNIILDRENIIKIERIAWRFMDRFIFDYIPLTHLFRIVGFMAKSSSCSN